MAEVAGAMANQFKVGDTCYGARNHRSCRGWKGEVMRIADDAYVVVRWRDDRRLQFTEPVAALTKTPHTVGGDSGQESGRDGPTLAGRGSEP